MCQQQPFAWPEASQHWPYRLLGGARPWLQTAGRRLSQWYLLTPRAVVEGAPRMAAASACVPRVSASLLLCLLERLQDQHQAV